MLNLNVKAVNSFIILVKFIILMISYSILGYCEGYLLVYSETHIDLFDCTSGDWLQTLNVKRARPLNISGSLTSCVINDMPYVIYLSNLRQRKYILYITYILNFTTFIYHSIFILLFLLLD